MYLNVNLTPPQSGGTEGSCTHTPKTPEILNSLISLTSGQISSYANYHSQATHGDLLSPASSSASPSEEKPGTQFGGTPTHSGGTTIPHMSPASSIFDPGGDDPVNSTTRVSLAFRGVPTVAGTPSPPVPELPSPVNTVEATKLALIKEGLKHQIKSKLQAAGLAPGELPSDTKLVKEEVGDNKELTPQDQERRSRRRERNKIAATKCRNKKKEKTYHLMTESETVEDQNLRLKSEIERLTSEKAKLRKLLLDPSHVASCRHSCRPGPQQAQAPLVVVTSPGAPEMLLTPSSSGRAGDGGGGSPQGEGPTPDAFVSQAASSPSTSFVSFVSSSSPSSTSSSAISPRSLPSVSPPQLTPRNRSRPCMPAPAGQAPAPSTTTTSGCYTTNGDTSLLSLSYSTPPAPTEPLSLHSSPPPENHFLPPLGSSSKPPSHNCHQPYALNRCPRTSPYPEESTVSTPSDLPERAEGCRDYYPLLPTLEEESSPFVYPTPPHPTPNGALPLSSLDPVTCPGPLSPPCTSVAGKARVSLLSPHTSSHFRYTPYDRDNRHQPSYHNTSLHPPQLSSHQLSPQHQSPTSLHNLEQPTTPLLPQSCAEVAVALETLHQHSSYNFFHNSTTPSDVLDTYLPASCNASASCQLIGDTTSNQFYPSCSYGNIASFTD